MVRKLLIFFLIMSAIKTSICSEELVKKLQQVESEERLSWKIIYLHRLLTQKEQIEALDQAVQEKVHKKFDPDLSKELKESRKLTSDRRIATLYYLLPSAKKQIKALTKKLLEKIDNIKLEEESYAVKTDAGY